MNSKLLTVFGLLLFSLGFFYLQTPENKYVYKGEKQKGLAFVAPPNELGDSAFVAVTKVNAGWLALMPYGFVGKDSPEFRYIKTSDQLNEGKHQWWGEAPDGLTQCIIMAKKQGLKIMMKPHMWIGRGTFTGDFRCENEKDWKIFEDSFAAYILQNAAICEANKVEILCIATEMHTMVAERPEFWIKLINDIKKVYSGKLTYAENWDSYEKVPFWNSLDFIGVDAYFPLAKGQNPSKKEISKAWDPWLKNMSKLSAKLKKPVLFTEIGYRSCDFSTEKPWETNYDLPVNTELQQRAYEVFYEKVWPQPWLAGSYLWKWFPMDFKKRKNHDLFAFQNNPALQTIKENYAP